MSWTLAAVSSNYTRSLSEPVTKVLIFVTLHSSNKIKQNGHPRFKYNVVIEDVVLADGY
jgi:hypothetical protein